MKTHTLTIANWLAISLALVVTTTATWTPEDHSVAQVVEYAVGFSPDTSAQESILEAINASRSQIFVATYSFTSRPVAKALADAHLRGVKVFVIADELEARKKYSIASYLANRGVPVRLNSKVKIIDCNFLIVDDVSLELAGFNDSSKAANWQSGSMHVHRDGAPKAGEFAQAWSHLWDGSAPLVKKY
jgi:phosphatidylserine/phosphatidylglycerophosphate/cardiolipin synthase-like enzyme